MSRAVPVEHGEVREGCAAVLAVVAGEHQHPGRGPAPVTPGAARVADTGGVQSEQNPYRSHTRARYARRDPDTGLEVIEPVVVAAVERRIVDQVGSRSSARCSLQAPNPGTGRSTARSL